MSQKVLTFDLKTVSRVTRDMATFVSILGTLDICWRVSAGAGQMEYNA